MIEKFKRKRVTFNVTQKLELIEQFEQVVPVAYFCEVHGIKKNCLNYLYSKTTLQQFSLTYSIDSYINKLYSSEYKTLELSPYLELHSI